MRALRTLGVLLLAAAAAVPAYRWAVGTPGPAFAGRVDPPAWTGGGPAVLIDDAHWNRGTAQSRLAALAQLLAADGYRVLPGANGARAETLTGARVSIIVNPLGVPGLLRRAAAPAGLDGLAFFDEDGVLQQEIETTAQWVENGGSLLLAADEAPDARGARGLAARLGVRMHERLVVDVGHAEAESPGRLVFSRENGLIGAHPITDGGVGLPGVNRVVTFGGQALAAPSGAAVLLGLSPSATAVARAGDPPTSGQPVGGLAMAVAFEMGRGRVVVLGDSHVLTNDAGADGRPTGLEWPSSDNTRFVQAIMRWLSRR